MSVVCRIQGVETSYRWRNDNKFSMETFASHWLISYPTEVPVHSLMQDLCKLRYTSKRCYPDFDRNPDVSPS